ncbi:GNAT family N-acetyltransferase [Sphingomonas sp. SFZ2018-12]|uniref:GNAT family N-acetyltransferase n=1 Tax=Sphingomonas sp. SFZ2018-12 TaxID=2683197 RepID=UPI001F0E67B5|nr:GNAT family N-acetyltransferase [Sphingomonas sp. SFZ2018-12]MCH4892014.1 GNAT family N-acetyltransferase [Sphingomonas sp. SFZ2018-12]
MLALRRARANDLDALRGLMARAIATLQRDFLTPAQIEASRAVMGLDSQLIADGTYFVVEAAGDLAGCGGWSRRATLYGSDASTTLREPRLLDPATDAARIRAMYTDPRHARRGVGRMILAACERAAAGEGFTRAELMATMAGVPLYRAAGYRPVEAVTEHRGGEPVPLLRMTRAIGAAASVLAPPPDAL